LRIGVDVYQDYPDFLAAVAQWIHERRYPPNSKSKSKGARKRRGLACEVIRAASNVWVGVGVYTVCEIFYLAGMDFLSICLSLFMLLGIGLSPLLLEYEVFDCASRTARLCEAFWAFADASQQIHSYVQSPSATLYLTI